MTSTLPGLAGTTFDAVLFDLDATLIDSTAAMQRCWVRWAQEFGVDPQRLLGWHGVPSAQIVAALLPHLPDQGRVLASARIDELEVQDTGGIVVLPGSRQALVDVPPERVAIATSCTRALANARIGATDLRVPEVVVTADDVTVGKPDPAPYLLAARRLGFDPARCLVVEDAPSGLVSARAAGCATLAVSTTHRPHELEANAVVSSLADVRFGRVTGGVVVAPGTGSG